MLRPMENRNQSIVSFGGHGEEQVTMNRQGKANVRGEKPPVINPKELSNEELEYIIRTGQLPPRLNNQAPPVKPKVPQ